MEATSASLISKDYHDWSDGFDRVALLPCRDFVLAAPSLSCRKIPGMDGPPFMSWRILGEVDTLKIEGFRISDKA